MKTFYTTPLPFFVLAFGIFITISSPHLFSDGMFMDGLFYATISRNLSEGIGSFWFLKFTETCHPTFHEHPPLVFGIQSLFFSIFGDSIFVERWYSLFIYIISGGIIHFIWKSLPITKNKLSWLPLILWVCIPLVTWSAANNILENTLTVFILASFLFLVKFTQKNNIIFILLAGICIACAFLSKGFVGLFTWAFFGVFWIASKDFSLKQAIINTLLLIFCSFIPFILLAVIHYESIESLQIYFSRQVVNSLQNVQTVSSRFYILGRAFTEMLVSIIIICVGYFVLSKKYNISIKTHPYKTWILLTLGIGLAGILPVMISLKQSGFYIIAAFPFLCISLSLFLSPYLEKVTFENSKFQKIITWLSLSLLLLGISSSIYHTNKVMRDKQKLQDFYIIQSYIPVNTTVGICHELHYNWSLHGYYYRHAYISLACKTHHHNTVDFFISTNECNPEILSNFEKIDTPTTKYFVYKKSTK